MADSEVVLAQMFAAGFVDVTFKRVDQKVLVGKDIDEAIAFQLAIGPAGEVYRTAGREAEDKRTAIEADLRNLFECQDRNFRGIWMDSSSWIVSARAAD